jgi:hypothetical protein
MGKFETDFKLKTNPFRMTPATNPDEIIWAGFKEIKEKFEKRIERSVRIPNSTLVLNWGEYGSGKTHAARFFSKEEELERISKKSNSQIPYSMVIPLPKGKEPVFSIFTSVIDKLDIPEIREKFEKINIDDYIGNFGSNLHIQNVLKAIFKKEIDHLQIKKYLYGNISTAELKFFNTCGILRQLKEDTDFTLVLSGLFSCLTNEKTPYSCVILWIDEFEDLSVLSSSNIDKTNNFLREILDNTANNLLVFLNLTQSAMFSVEDLGQFVYDSVRSRIKERINFDLPSKENFKDYLRELLNYFRSGTDSNPYFPFDEAVIDDIISEKGNVSLREFNEALCLLLELCEMDDKHPISADIYKEYKSEIIWDKN